MKSRIRQDADFTYFEDFALRLRLPRAGFAQDKKRKFWGCAEFAYLAFFAEVGLGFLGVRNPNLKINVRRIRKIRRILRHSGSWMLEIGWRKAGPSARPAKRDSLRANSRCEFGLVSAALSGKGRDAL